MILINLEGELFSSLFTEFESGQWFLNSYRRNCLEKIKVKNLFKKGRLYSFFIQIFKIIKRFNLCN